MGCGLHSFSIKRLWDNWRSGQKLEVPLVPEPPNEPVDPERAPAKESE